ncbi:MAG: histidinol-phosphatase HisJ family protein [Firmicutes bacterium]|nr:histidinol-phosphatase HisJ family protein [Bacillota bacterium]
MFRADYHIHTEYSIDSEAPIEEVIEAGIQKGLNEMAITDHVDFDPHYPLLDYGKYIPIILELKEKYKNDINIVLGVEVGLENKWKKHINSFISDFPFDFVIGSSHSVLTYDLYYDMEKYFSVRTKEEAYSTYFTEMLENIKTCHGFNVYGHLDFVTRYGMYEDNSLKYTDYREYIDPCLKALIEKGCGIEINTSGFRYGINDTYPNIDILKRYKQLGGEILTCGSDSHKVKDVADHISHAYEMAKAAGFKYITTFQNKKPYFQSLD